MKFFIKTFGCQQNKADSERIASAFQARGMKPARGFGDSDYVVINTCMIRQSAENRVYGLVKNLGQLKRKKLTPYRPAKRDWYWGKNNSYRLYGRSCF